MNQKVRPYQILLFLLAVMLLLTGLMVVFPDKGITIYKENKLKGRDTVSDSITWRFASFDDIFVPDTMSYQDISGIIETADSTRIPGLLETMVDHAQHYRVLYKPARDKRSGQTVKINMGELTPVQQPIEYPQDNRLVLYPFFDALQTTGEELIRVMHYGDSQIEGDRITSFLRYKLQSQFGGSGVGLLPALQVHNYQRSIRHQTSGPWERYTTMEHGKKIRGQRFGALACISRFTPLPYSIEDNDSTGNTEELPENRDKEKAQLAEKRQQNDEDLNEDKRYTASVSFRPSSRTYHTNRYYSQCRIFYGYNDKPVVAQLYSGEELYESVTLEPNQSFQVLRWQVPKPTITIRFSGYSSPEIYGIALDAAAGVAVDNIAGRGSAGLMFGKMNKYHLKQMMDELNPKLIILQFGGNITPYITESYNYYKRMFSYQLGILREVCPFTSIVVIGPADMSRKVDDQYISYPNIPDIRDALKEAAFNHGAAFWDMYEAMGGENSMPSWVNNEPPLAAPDYTHFSHKGAEIIAQMFYNSLITEYNKYLKYNHQ